MTDAGKAFGTHAPAAPERDFKPQPRLGNHERADQLRRPPVRDPAADLQPRRGTTRGARARALTHTVQESSHDTLNVLPMLRLFVIHGCEHHEAEASEDGAMPDQAT